MGLTHEFRGFFYVENYEVAFLLTSQQQEGEREGENTGSSLHKKKDRPPVRPKTKSSRPCMAQ